MKMMMKIILSLCILTIISTITTPVFAATNNQPSNSQIQNVLDFLFGNKNKQIIGATGATGKQGPIGATGPIGVTGPMGPIGQTGLQGPIGLNGPIGSTGSTGIAGSTGPTGPSGLEGPTGATGIQGATGLVGPVGSTGSSGLLPTVAEFDLIDGTYGPLHHSPNMDLTGRRLLFVKMTSIGTGTLTIRHEGADVYEQWIDQETFYLDSGSMQSHQFVVPVKDAIYGLRINGNFTMKITAFAI